LMECALEVKKVPLETFNILIWISFLVSFLLPFPTLEIP